MTELFLLFLFLAGALMVGCGAWPWVCAAGLDRHGLAESTVGWILLALAWIAGAGAFLGFVGGLGAVGFFLIHAAGLAGTLAWRRRELADDFARGQRWLGDWSRLLRGGSAAGGIVAGLGLVLIVLALLAARAEPVVFDALTYRLSRIGQWLQDGRITHYATDDPRLNYMPVAPDVIVAWLLGATTDGYRLAPLSQLAGGLLLLGATYGLARIAGLGRLAALGAVALVLGMANVAVQFTTIQSDLFTAGVFSASYFLWHRALLRGEGSWLAGLGAGLAWGSKGTMFYLAPGAAIWVGWLAWRHRRSWRALWPTGAAALLATAVLALPVYVRNLETYGGPFGPREAVILHHGESLTLPQRWGKLRINLGTTAVQLLDPNSQPPWGREWCRTLGRKLMQFLPAVADRDVFLGYPRRAQLQVIMDAQEPDADLLGCGVVAAVLFLGGIVAAALSHDATARQVLVWGAGVVIYVLVQHSLVQWHQWAFRFMVLAAPGMGVVGAWGLSRLERRLQIVAWTMAVASALAVFANVQVRANQAAWQAVTRPDRAFSHFLYGSWRRWAEDLEPAGLPLRVALPINAPLAAFYRQPTVQPVRLAPVPDATIRTAEQFLGGDPGWVIVPAARFVGAEGRVHGEVYRYFGQDGTNPNSLAAYRRLRPGEEPVPMIYRALRQETPGRSTEDLLVRTWSQTLGLRVHNRSTGEWQYSILTADARRHGVLAPGATIDESLPAPGAVAIQVLVDFRAVGSGPETAAVPVVEVTGSGAP